ncbi:MAG: hypothetical protein NC331_17245 [Lachnospiraceae bacterium]|nr:hypothetical protein [Lachnospiraceae bacterium]MCM1241089.1 hypothetical protein [Lachnospiraceae bacterium]MCM1305107.1 hypothetical protein [Butyrivibrio sp.]MCM1344125.1 hypothetical protein [Muribaculaceae bacterium]MCM1411918.1 hypothetical protein [Lachnospiraceae bacterium]
MQEREYNEQRYNESKVEGDDLQNAAVCDVIADDSLTWNPGEAVYWRMQAIEKAENHYGKAHMANTFYYDKIVNDLLVKNSYKKADSWNKKSKKIKIKEKGEHAFEAITNELYELRIDIALERYEAAAGCLEHLKESLQRDSQRDPAVLYRIYLEASSTEGNTEVRQLRANDGYFIDHAMNLARKLYGEDSLEMIDLYRHKAFGVMGSSKGAEENQEALELFKKAFLMAKEKGSAGYDLVRWILEGIKCCWDRKMEHREGVKWIYSHISTQAAIDFMGTYSAQFREEMKEELDTVVKEEDRKTVDKGYAFYQMIEQGKIDLANMPGSGD